MSALFGFELIRVSPGGGMERESNVALSGPAPQASAVKRELRNGEPGVYTKPLGDPEVGHGCTETP